MHDTAAFLVDHIFPDAPVRMWVVSVPPPLRYLLAYDTEIFAAVLGIFLTEVFALLRRIAKRELGLDDPSHAHTAAVTFPQRFGDGLRLNAHAHSLVVDGVFLHKGDNDQPEFRALPPPTDVEVRAIGTNVWMQTTRLLQKLGKYFDADPAEADTLAEDHPLLAAAYAASIRGMVASGPRAGQPVLALGQLTHTEQITDASRTSSSGDNRPLHGYSVHAGVRVPAWDRSRLERLARYAARGPIANERVSLTGDGRVMVRLRRPWQNGTTHLLMTPHELIEKLCALVPPPRFNLVRFHGLFAPAHRLRALIVPGRDDEEPRPGQLPLFGRRKRARRRDGKPLQKPRPRTPWPTLMARTFGLDVLVCSRCGGRRKLVSAVAPPQLIERLRAIEQEQEVPATRFVRGPPVMGAQGDLFAQTSKQSAA